MTHFHVRKTRQFVSGDLEGLTITTTKEVCNEEMAKKMIDEHPVGAIIEEDGLLKGRVQIISMEFFTEEEVW